MFKIEKLEHKKRQHKNGRCVAESRAHVTVEAVVVVGVLDLNLLPRGRDVPRDAHVQRHPD